MIMAPPTRATRSTLAAAAQAPPRASTTTTTWADLPGGVLDGGEIVLLAVKPSMWRPVFDSVPWIVTCCLLAGTILGLSTPLPGLSLTATAQLVLLVACVRLAFAIVRWVPTWYVLTNRRIINIRGVRTPRIAACLLVDVHHTGIHRSAVDNLVGLGSIFFAVDHTDGPPQPWQSLQKPDEVHARIRRAIESAVDHHTLGL